MFERQFVDALAEQIAAKLRPTAAKSERWPELMSIETAAKYLDRSEHSIRCLIESKTLPACRIDRRVQVRRIDLDRVMERSTS
jgi:excisionase family DNA binding protein